MNFFCGKIFFTVDLLKISFWSLKIAFNGTWKFLHCYYMSTPYLYTHTNLLILMLERKQLNLSKDHYLYSVSSLFWFTFIYLVYSPMIHLKIVPYFILGWVSLPSFFGFAYFFTSLLFMLTKITNSVCTHFSSGNPLIYRSVYNLRF